MTLLSAQLLESMEPSVRDVNEACLLPPIVYTSDEFYEFERDAIFGHEWLCVGRVDQVPNPGAWFTIELAGEPLLVVRDKEDRVRVLSAVCRHRGMVVADGRGTASTFTCPYHHWSYALDGRMLGAPAMERAVGFDKSQCSLPSLPIEIWQGWIFTSFDREPTPLAPGLRELEPLLANYQLDTAVTIPSKSLPGLPWNWKVMLENFNDGYHASRLHESLQTFAPSGMSDFFPWHNELRHISRVQHFTHIDGSFNPTMKCLLPVFPKLTDDDRTHALFILVPPTLAIAVVPDEIAYFIVKPQGANTIDIDIGYCFHPTQLDVPLFDKLFEAAQAGVDNFNIQDVYADTMVQKGLRSRFGPRGRYSWQEDTLAHFNRWLVQRYRAHWPASTTVGASRGGARH